MFCPSCGKESLPNQHFCKSCGTDLGVVSRAMTSREPVTLEQIPPEQTTDLASINNQIAHGYQDVIKGGGILLAIFVVVVLLHEKWAIWVVMWLFIWGCSSLAKGIGNVLAARHTMNNLRLQSSQTLPNQSRTPEPWSSWARPASPCLPRK